MKKEILYIKIAKILEDQILSETLRIGDKLPSIRSVQKIYDVSLNTVKLAFLELESKSLIEARPKSGYYVSKTSQRKCALPSVSKPETCQNKSDPEDLISKVFDTLHYKDIRQFSLGVPDPSFLPIAKLNKGVIKTIRNLEGSGTAYEPLEGSFNLRRNIAKWSLVLEGKITEDDLITTSGAMNAIFNCLMAVTKRGDTLAIESPVYFGIIHIAKAMGLNVIELPTHPVTGVDIDALRKIIDKVDACCFISNFSNPLGSLMPEERKKELVQLLTYHNIPLIEDDLYGNLYFGTSRPKPCKAFDEAGIVMWCGSVSKTLAPGYRVGWVAPGKYKEKILRQKLIQTISTPSLYQEVIADFLENGRFDHHLRGFRQKLHTNCLKYQRAVEEYFPESTKISQPQGGFVLWLELDNKIDTAQLYDVAVKQNISFAPGRMFTQHDQFNNCMRLNFALKWDESLENDLKRLGTIVKNAL
ncbi:PLP-dependent aminotransferase family protein [Chryseobacterium sp. Ch-15]|uniref:PLP-dependent aminotransferase family protein n=1 Tax=Chryseobacterium muglaense TaxID=2893752 RepID=A0A9Q3UTP6_9FLAO|nr:PLP-dependent aminotransferase family protein [Chryseobacterium muglaense]MBD3906949.1 PLP-dependent aminotransferase family protein [Chryseobacterium muglaense]MCC9033179.1 PLP-dependent aminotransferase family protein [Chryseobacterium muglaense]MCM2556117.1 PLP-dependent aminotransferase family protein [Chryseobacterium muglaense]